MTVWYSLSAEIKIILYFDATSTTEKENSSLTERSKGFNYLDISMFSLEYFVGIRACLNKIYLPQMQHIDRNKHNFFIRSIGTVHF